MTNKDNGDWDFGNLQVKEETEEKTNTRRMRPDKILTKKDLTLDEKNIPKARTRTALAKEMQTVDDSNDADVYELAPIPKRAIAFIIDSAFLVAILFSVQMTAPLIRKILQHFLDVYRLHFLISDNLVMKMILFSSAFLALFFLVIIPVSFFNHSLGKKMTGLKVRGIEKYTLTLGEAIKRELIMKPISILIVAGFVTPFFSKQRLSIHDMVMKTLVVED